MAAPKVDEKQQAITLRNEGYSYKEIAKKLRISPASAHGYARDVPLSKDLLTKMELRFKEKQKNGAERRGQILAKKAADKRLDFQMAGRELYKSSEMFRQVVLLYWAEGAKARTHAGITNSDPYIIFHWVTWLNSVGSDWKLIVHYYEENGISEDRIIDFWREWAPGLSNERLGKFWKKPIANKSKRTPNFDYLKNPYGIASVVARGTPTKLRQWIEGGILEIKDSLDKLRGP